MSADPRIGTELAGYRIVQLLGKGGTSEVYLAEDRRLGRRVALKILSPELARDERFRARFLRESRAAASIDHPNVIPIHEAGEADGELFIVMRHVAGPTLADVIEQRGRLDPAEALGLLGDVADALDAAHEDGLVHRDVKPGNVLVAQRRTGSHVYLADFGLTKRGSSESALTETGHFIGTPDYVAPELVEGGEAGPRSDVYSLGCVVFECLTGRPPFRKGSLMATLWAHVNEPPPSALELRGDLPPALDHVFRRALAKEPGKRYATCRELLEAAKAAFPAGKLVLPRLRRARRLALLSAVPLAAGAVALGAIFLGGGEGGAGARLASPAAPTTTLALDAVQRIDPSANRLVATIAVGGRIGAVAADVRNVWVSNIEAETLGRIDLDANRLEKTRVTPGAFRAISSERGVVWASTTGRSAIAAEIERASLGLEDVRAVGQPEALDLVPYPIAVGFGSVWVASPKGRVYRLYPQGARRLDVPQPVRGIATGERGPWVAAGRSLVQIDAEHAAIANRIPLDFVPAGVAAGGGSLWVTDARAGRAVQVDPDRRRVVGAVTVGRGVGDVLVAFGAVWVANRQDETVARIDPRIGRVVAMVRVGGTPIDLAASPDALWVAVRAR